MPKPLAEIAIDAGLVTRADIARVARVAEQRGVPLVVALVRDGGVDELALLAAIRKQTRVPSLDPGTVRPDADALRMVPGDLCRRHRVLPVQVVVGAAGRHRVLRVAMADPSDAAAFTEVEHVAGVELDVSVLPLSAIEELIEQGLRAFTTQVTPRRRPFGDGVRVTTQRHARAPGPARPVGDDTALTSPATVPFHSVSDEADVAVRVQALVDLLVARGLFTEADYEQAVIDRMRDGRDVTTETASGDPIPDDD
ncbi:MAG: hypothetical protein H6709_15665 [Kofleriaceae bacterium]|nr:hypothetical protein [Myxococcales bacterium]MCB9561463.1 hypothetical protein [Kofleriaceae bacterium]MCB9573517.1 hypothetical protein [Kofleriaceae bacterium]